MMLSSVTGSIGRVRSAVLILSIGLLSAAPVRAQSASATSDTSSDSLQEVVITAEKRVENAQTTAIAITTISDRKSVV